MRFFTSSLTQVLAVITLTVALAGVGFGHRLGNPTANANLQAFFASGGSWADLCVDSDTDTPTQSNHCDACRLVDAISQAEITTGPVEILLLSSQINTAISRQIRLCRKPVSSRPSRAPPVA